MRKHDEGYALPFVLVVMVVVCLVATSILSFSLRNLQSQSASIQRMEDKYLAQGEIEKVIAVLNTATVEGKQVELKNTELDLNGEVLTVTVKAETVTIVCELKVPGIQEHQKNGNQFTLYRTSGSAPITYESYEITSIGGGGE